MENRRKQYGGDEKEAFPAIARFVFDLDRNKLRYEEFEEFRGTAHRVDKTFTFVFNGNAYTAYGTGAYQRHLGCASIHGNESDCTEILDSVHSGHPLEVVEEGLKGFWLLGDETFLIRASYNGYAVFCFDPFIIWPTKMWHIMRLKRGLSWRPLELEREAKIDEVSKAQVGD